MKKESNVYSVIEDSLVHLKTERVFALISAALRIARSRPGKAHPVQYILPVTSQPPLKTELSHHFRVAYFFELPLSASLTVLKEACDKQRKRAMSKLNLLAFFISAKSGCFITQMHRGIFSWLVCSSSCCFLPNGFCFLITFLLPLVLSLGTAGTAEMPADHCVFRDHSFSLIWYKSLGSDCQKEMIRGVLWPFLHDFQTQGLWGLLSPKAISDTQTFQAQKHLKLRVLFLPFQMWQLGLESPPMTLHANNNIHAPKLPRLRSVLRELSRKLPKTKWFFPLQLTTWIQPIFTSFSIFLFCFPKNDLHLLRTSQDDQTGTDIIFSGNNDIVMPFHERTPMQNTEEHVSQVEARLRNKGYACNFDGYEWMFLSFAPLHLVYICESDLVLNPSELVRVVSWATAEAVCDVLHAAASGYSRWQRETFWFLQETRSSKWCMSAHCISPEFLSDFLGFLAQVWSFHSFVHYLSLPLASNLT